MESERAFYMQAAAEAIPAEDKSFDAVCLALTVCWFVSSACKHCWGGLHSVISLGQHASV